MNPRPPEPPPADVVCRRVVSLLELMRGEPPPHLRDPHAFLEACRAKAGSRPPFGSEPSTPPGDAVAAALAEAGALPAYERPATVAELARWVKTRLYGHAPMPADRMTTFLLAFAWVHMRRPAGEAVNDWSRVPDGSVRSTLVAAGGTTAEGGRLLPAVDALLDTDRPTGELLLLSEYAGQSPEALAALTERSVSDVRRELAAARAWIADELNLPAGAFSGG